MSMQNRYVMVLISVISIFGGCLGADAAKNMMGVGNADAQSSCTQWEIGEVDTPYNVEQETVTVPAGWEPFAPMDKYTVLTRRCID